NRETPLWLGSIKSNIGHTQAAAGVAGIIKMVQAMQHGLLPKTLHVDAPSHHVDWEAGAVSLLTEPTPWPELAGDRPRRAAVSSFGISGTNAHVILEAVPQSVPEPAATASPVPWVLSGRTEQALRDQAARLAAYLAEHPGLDPADVGYTLATAKTHHAHRAGVVGGESGELVRGLEALASGRAAAGLVKGTANEGKVVFVFPGQGSQWPEMARELLDSEPVFAEHLRRCAEALAPYTDWSLIDTLRGTGASLERVDVVQPVLFAVMTGLAALWQSAGVRPDAVVGHSQGEIAAAYVAGALSLEDAAKVAALRSRAITALAGTGTMASVPLPAEEVEARYGWVEIAAVNGPSATIVAGSQEAVAELVERCQADGVSARTVKVDYASHSSHVAAIRDQLTEALAGIRPGSSRVAFYSTVTGEPLDTAGLDAAYWYTNLRSTVRYETAVRALRAAGHRVFVEASPHPVLTAATEDTLDGAGVAIGSLRRDDGGRERVLLSFAQAHAHGVPVNWTAVFAGIGGGARSEPTGGTGAGGGTGA
ncbi:type I polyketide synthase, partial [Nonomuraea zeae]